MTLTSIAATISFVWSLLVEEPLDRAYQSHETIRAEPYTTVPTAKRASSLYEANPYDQTVDRV